MGERPFDHQEVVATPSTELSPKEAAFCRNCALLGNAREAARTAGYPAKALDQTIRALLDREQIRTAIAQELEALSGEGLRNLALRGLCKLAFGGVSDAASLAWQEEAPSPAQLAELDFFCLSELRRPKSGGCELRFYDRMKALELLLLHGGAPQESASAFLEALQAAAPEGDPSED